MGIGWYPIDIHSAHPDDIGVSLRTFPFQIPAGALVPQTTVNLLAGSKNIGTTHISNGCYRLHPVEWNIGEAAGTIAGLALARGAPPSAMVQDESLLAGLQHHLVDSGVPLHWFADLHPDSQRFQAAQIAAVGGRIDDARTLHACRLHASDRSLIAAGPCEAPALLEPIP